MLGLDPGASAAAVNDARRGLAKRAHPDAGGSVDAMQRINDAADAALRQLASRDRSGSRTRGGPTSPTRHGGGPRTDPGATSPPGARRDHPSFTVEALPVETFEGLLVVASWLGEVIDDEPPYVLEVALTPPLRGWCRLDLVPDAGASTVSLAVAADPGFPVPDIDRVRDAWIDGLNQLDWAGPDGPRRGPLPS